MFDVIGTILLLVNIAMDYYQYFIGKSVNHLEMGHFSTSSLNYQRVSPSGSKPEEIPKVRTRQLQAQLKAGLHHLLCCWGSQVGPNHRLILLKLVSRIGSGKVVSCRFFPKSWKERPAALSPGTQGTDSWSCGLGLHVNLLPMDWLIWLAILAPPTYSAHVSWIIRIN
jgi:hypothetical protein